MIFHFIDHPPLARDPGSNTSELCLLQSPATLVSFGTRPSLKDTRTRMSGITTSAEILLVTLMVFGVTRPTWVSDGTTVR